MWPIAGLATASLSIRMDAEPNHSKDRTQGSRSEPMKFVNLWRLARAAHAEREPANVSLIAFLTRAEI